MSILQTVIEAKLEGKKIVLFGAMGGGASLIRDFGIRQSVGYLVDNSKYLQGTTVFDKPVYHPDRLSEESRDIYIRWRYSSCGRLFFLAPDTSGRWH